MYREREGERKREREGGELRYIIYIYIYIYIQSTDTCFAVPQLISVAWYNLDMNCALAVPLWKV